MTSSSFQVLQHVQKHLLDGLVPLAIQLKRLLLPMVIVLNGTNTNVSTITNQRTTKTTTTNTSSSNSSTTVAVASLLHSPLDRIDALSSLNAILLNSKIRIRIDHDVDDERRTIQFVQVCELFLGLCHSATAFPIRLPRLTMEQVFRLIVFLLFSFSFVFLFFYCFFFCNANTCE